MNILFSFSFFFSFFSKLILIGFLELKTSNHYSKFIKRFFPWIYTYYLCDIIPFSGFLIFFFFSFSNLKFMEGMDQTQGAIFNGLSWMYSRWTAMNQALAFTM
jgi:hypothetical protein